MRRHRGLPALAALALLAGCGGGGDAAPTTVERTRVEVVQGSDGAASTAAANGFDARAIYERDAPGVVTVLAVTGGGGGLLDSSGGQGAEGSGFVLGEKGEVVTNAHVVTEGTGSAIRAADQVYVRFQDGNQVGAKIVGFDANSDVALLRIDPAGLTLRPLRLGTTKGLAVGAPVAAIGSPFGQEQSLSIGVVSATDRTIDSLTQFAISGAIQTDAAINHGNSGGPLVDAGGRVLGINSQIRSESGDGSGVGFAVPVDLVKNAVAQLREDGKVEYAYLGVSTTPLYPQLAERLGLPVSRGVLVAQVVDGGPSAAAGLRAGHEEFRFQSRRVPRDADVITALAGRPVRDSDDLGTILNDYRPGQAIDLAIVRDKKPKTLRVKLTRRPVTASP
jgi:S1-C subfamily serine protease